MFSFIVFLATGFNCFYGGVLETFWRYLILSMMFVMIKNVRCNLPNGKVRLFLSIALVTTGVSVSNCLRLLECGGRGRFSYDMVHCDSETTRKVIAVFFVVFKALKNRSLRFLVSLSSGYRTDDCLRVSMNIFLLRRPIMAAIIQNGFYDRSLDFSFLSNIRC